MGEWTFIIELVKGAGAASGPIFALMWWLERRERLDDAQKRDGALIEVRLALNTLSTIFNTRPGGK